MNSVALFRLFRASHRPLAYRFSSIARPVVQFNPQIPSILANPRFLHTISSSSNSKSTSSSSPVSPLQILTNEHQYHSHQILSSIQNDQYPIHSATTILSSDQSNSNSNSNIKSYHPLITSNVTSPSFHHRRKRIHSPLRGGIQKPMYSSRSLSTSTKSTDSKSVDKKNGEVTWRDALKSPRKAMTYSVQLMHAFNDWLKHMWAGIKLLAADVRVSSKVLKRITMGKQISRRERNFIVKTGVDLARLVPFSLFLIIPLAEFALPFALRLFPNMLPSQFQDNMKQEEDLKRRLKGRLELAKYLRDVVEERAKSIKVSTQNSELKKNAEDLSQFLQAIRSGKEIHGSDVSRFARFFNDELTIDGAARPQLIAMCKYMGISPYGHDLFLRFKLRSRLNAIKKDDMEIMWEGGAASLTNDEVAKACRDRGIRESGSFGTMRRQLEDWLDLSQKKEIPGSLLILSRALLFTGGEPSSEGLVETLGSLPEDVIEDARKAADIGEETTAERLEETLRQAKLIEIESEREVRKEKEDEARRLKKEAEEEIEKDAAAENIVPDQSVVADKKVMRTVAAAEAKIMEELGMENQPSTDSDKPEGEKPVAESKPAEIEEKDEEEIEDQRDSIRKMLLALGQLSSDSAVEREREELRSLKVELAEAEVMVKGTEEEDSSDMRRFKSLVAKLEREVERVDRKVGLKMKLLDKDNDGVMSLGECKEAMTMIVGERDDEAVSETFRRLDADEDGNISKGDLTRVLKEMKFEYGLSDEEIQTKNQTQQASREQTVEISRESRAAE